MKRLSAIQKEIEVLAKRVPQLTDEQRKWAEGKFEYYVHIRQGHNDAVCPNCKGHFHPYDMVGEQSRWNKVDKVYICPHCGARIQVSVEKDSVKKAYYASHKQQDFFQIMDVVGGWQVTRCIYMQRQVYVRKPNTDWEFYEVCQAWNHPKVAKTHFRAFAKTMMSSWYFNPYSLHDWELVRNEDGTYKTDENGSHIIRYLPRVLEPRRPGSSNYFDTNCIAPKARILPQYRKMGLTLATMSRYSHNFLWLFECFSAGNYKPMYETLWKAKEWKIFKRVTERYGREDAEKVFSAWKVCKRNRYTQYKQNTEEWIDMVDMLIAENKDIRNAHYVCPADMHASHNALLAEKNRREEIERERRQAQWRIEHAEEIARDEERRRVESERRLKDAIKEEEDFINAHKQYFGISIPTKNYTIVVLQNIKEFKHEGDTLHHCVFHCAYYRKKDSLILSARNADNEPIETIEVNLNSFTIAQCYGEHDEFTPLHNDIVKTMNENMWRIKDIAKGKVRAA